MREVLTDKLKTKRLRLLRLSRPVFCACEQKYYLHPCLPLIMTSVWYRFCLKVARKGFRSIWTKS